MAGRRAPSRKAIVVAQTPKVSDAQTQRALDVVAEAVKDLQARRHLEQFTATEPGYVPASGSDSNTVLHADGVWREVTATAIGAVTDVTAGSSKVTVSPTTGSVVVDVVPANFAGIPQSGIVNLISDLAGKSNVGHTHLKADITDFAHTHLKADVTDFAHTHVKADVTDFAHTHVKADVTDFAHTHAQSDVTGLVADLAAINTSLAGKIDEVVAGTNLSGGGTSGAVTLNVVDSPSFAGNVTLGDNSAADAHVVNGSIDQAATHDGSALTINMTATDMTAQNAACVRTLNNATVNTTAGAINAAAVWAQTTATRSAGANNLCNLGLFASAENGQLNEAIRTDHGRVLLNRQSGDTLVGYASGVASPAKLAVNGTFHAVGNATVGGTLTVTGAITGYVPTSRTLSTTAPLAGGGDLSANRTLSLNDNGVTDAKLRDSAALSVIGRSANSTGDPGDIAAGTDGHVLRRSGTTLGFGTVPSTSVTGLITSVVAGTNLSGGGSSGTVTLNVVDSPSFAGSATLGDASADAHIVNGSLTLANAPAAGSLKVGAVQARVYLGRQIFTGSGTYTPTTGTKAVLVKMVGGGGGGGGATSGASGMSVGSGGWSGTYWEKWIAPGASITGGSVTVGSGGSGGASGGSDGSVGGDSSVVIQGTTYTAKGGNKGRGYNTVTTGSSTVYPYNYLTGSSASADVFKADPGTPGLMIGTNVICDAGVGGSGMFGVAGFKGEAATGVGVAGSGYGAGGSGAKNYFGTGTFTGGAGSAGLVIIEEYA